MASFHPGSSLSPEGDGKMQTGREGCLPTLNPEYEGEEVVLLLTANAQEEEEQIIIGLFIVLHCWLGWDTFSHRPSYLVVVDLWPKVNLSKGIPTWTERMVSARVPFNSWQIVEWIGIGFSAATRRENDEGTFNLRPNQFASIILLTGLQPLSRVEPADYGWMEWSECVSFNTLFIILVGLWVGQPQKVLNLLPISSSSGEFGKKPVNSRRRGNK